MLMMMGFLQYYVGADALVGREAYDFWAGEKRVEDCAEDGAGEDGGGG